jgi:hypothetical protein
MEDTRIDDDLVQIASPIIAQAAAVVLGFEGLLLLVMGFQNVMFVGWLGWIKFVPGAMFVLGVFTIVVAFMFGKVRTWAVWTAVILAAFLLLAAPTWLVISLFCGVFSLSSFMTAGCSPISLALVLAAVGNCLRVAAARRRLRERGMELGI